MMFIDQVRKFLRDWSNCSNVFSDLVIRRDYHGFLHYLCIYPDVNRVGPFWAIIRLAFFTVILTAHWCNLAISTYFLHDINFIYFSTALHYFFLVGITIEYLIIFNLKRKTMSSYYFRIHSNFYDYQEGEDAEIKEIWKRSSRRKKTVVILPVTAASTAGVIVVMTPVLDKYGTFDFSSQPSINFNLPLPMIYFFDSFTVFGFCVALSIQMGGIMLCGLILAAVGYTYMVLMITLQEQFRILIHRLDTIESRARALHLERYGFEPTGSDYQIYNTVSFQKCMNICLRKCVEHHKIILIGLQEFDNITSLTSFSFFFLGSLMVALAMLGSSYWKLLPGNTVASLVLCITEVAFIATISNLGQNLTDLNEDLRNSIYGIKWYHCDQRFSKDISILLIKTSRPFYIKAFGLINICNTTFANMINSAYSYYNIVIATSNN